MKINLFVIVLIIVFFGCNQKSKYYTHTGEAEGTIFHIKYEYKKPLNKEIDSLLNYFEDNLSIYRDSSLISEFNKSTADTFIFHNHLFADMLNKAFEIYKKTDGAFDITIANLVNAWGFGFEKIDNVDSVVIDSIMQFTGMDKLCFVGDTMLIKKDSRIKIDGNAIAKGQSVDFVAKYFENLGIENYLVEIGGEIRVKGKNPKAKSWIIGIDKPIDDTTGFYRKLERMIRLSNGAVATSGNYRKFYVKNGIKYSHTINPVTGYPVRHSLLSVTVLAEDCITADALATALMVMGTDKAKSFLKNTDVEALLIYDDNGKYSIYYTLGFEKLFVR